MGIGTGIAIYFIIWWMVLFISLPFRMKPQFEEGQVVEGTEAAAPANPQMLKRMFWNTLISGVVFFIYWFVVYYLGFGVDSIPQIIPIKKYEL
ncbi:MAG: DUF1467 family protein [Rhizobiaceae bacterium]